MFLTIYWQLLRKKDSAACTSRSESRCALIKHIPQLKEPVSKSWIKQLHTLPVLHFNRCLTAECSETTAHFNNFDIDNQI
jgi:hypothetical protein